MKKHNRRRSLAMPVIFICLLLMAVIITLFMMPFFSIKEVRITGNEQVSEDQLRSYLSFTEGDNIFLFNKSKCKNTILDNHYIQSVNINRILPSTVEITVNEYKLRGYIPYSGSYLYIDGEGRVLDIQKETSKSLPVVEGLKFNNVSVGEILKVDNPSAFETMVHLSKLFEKYELLSDVIRVDLTDVSDIHLYTGNVDINFGSFDDANRKLLMLIEVLKTFDTSVPGTINLTADKATYRYML